MKGKSLEMLLLEAEKDEEGGEGVKSLLITSDQKKNHVLFKKRWEARTIQS